MTDPSGFHDSGERYWLGRFLLAVSQRAAAGDTEVFSGRIYALDPELLSIDVDLRRRVPATAFTDLRDRGWLRRDRAEIKPRATRNASHETVWAVTPAFDVAALRAEAVVLMSDNWRPTSGPVQGRLPFEPGEREVG